jgi:hypothetical protein
MNGRLSPALVALEQAVQTAPLDLLTIKDLARRWQVKVPTARLICKRHQLRPLELTPMVLRYRIEDVRRKEAALAS